MQQGWLLKFTLGWGGAVNHSDVMLRRLKAVKDTGRFQSADVPGQKNIFVSLGTVGLQLPSVQKLTRI